MNIDYQPTDELADLVVAVTEGELQPEESARLSELIAEDADARAYYIDYMSTHAMLELQHGGLPVVELSYGETARLPSPPSTFFPMLIGLTVAASLLIAGLVGFQQLGRDSGRTVASLIEGDRIRYDDGTLSAVDGQLPVGQASVEAGERRIVLDSGVTIAIAGPASFAFVDAHNTFQLDTGRMRARVPPEAQGFILRIPRNEIVDLGTEFGVDVDTAGNVEVHVIKGAIKFGEHFDLTEGESKRIDEHGKQLKPQLEGKHFPKLK